MLQFFELASEGWFFCTGLDARVGMSNPFSDYKQRMFWYHVISWSIGGITALCLGLSGHFQYESGFAQRGKTLYNGVEHTDSIAYGFWWASLMLVNAHLPMFGAGTSHLTSTIRSFAGSR
jgi:hypothetical protein